MGQGAGHRLIVVAVAAGLAAGIAGQVLAADLTGRLGMGGSVGTSLLVGDYDYRKHARPRLTLDALFKYGFRPRWALVGQFGYGWNSYAYEESWLSSPAYADLRETYGLNADGVEKLTVMYPFTAGVEFRFGKDTWVPYVGAGGGLYMIDLFHDRVTAIDYRTLAKHRTYNLGFYARGGIEQFITDAVAMDYEVLGHLVFSEDREKFPYPRGNDLEVFGDDFLPHGGDLQFIQMRIGLRYYWGENDEEPVSGEAPPAETPEGEVLEPVAPEAVTPEPVTPETVAPEPVTPETAAPETAAPEAVTPAPPATTPPAVPETAPVAPDATQTPPPVTPEAATPPVTPEKPAGTP